MTTITIFRNQNHAYTGFSCSGHADYAEYGSDIVCAGISILVQSTINAIDQLTSERFTLDADEETGNIDFYLFQPAESKAKLLLDSMILGLEGIQSSYGKKFLKLLFKEV